MRHLEDTGRRGSLHRSLIMAVIVNYHPKCSHGGVATGFSFTESTDFLPGVLSMFPLPTAVHFHCFVRTGCILKANLVGPSRHVWGKTVIHRCTLDHWSAGRLGLAVGRSVVSPWAAGNSQFMLRLGVLIWKKGWMIPVLHASQTIAGINQDNALRSASGPAYIHVKKNHLGAAWQGRKTGHRCLTGSNPNSVTYRLRLSYLKISVLQIYHLWNENKTNLACLGGIKRMIFEKLLGPGRCSSSIFPIHFTWSLNQIMPLSVYQSFIAVMTNFHKLNG